MKLVERKKSCESQTYLLNAPREIRLRPTSWFGLRRVTIVVKVTAKEFFLYRQTFPKLFIVFLPDSFVYAEAIVCSTMLRVDQSAEIEPRLLAQGFQCSVVIRCFSFRQFSRFPPCSLIRKIFSWAFRQPVPSLPKTSNGRTSSATSKCRVTIPSWEVFGPAASPQLVASLSGNEIVQKHSIDIIEENSPSTSLAGAE